MTMINSPIFLTDVEDDHINSNHIQRKSRMRAHSFSFSFFSSSSSSSSENSTRKNERKSNNKTNNSNKKVIYANLNEKMPSLPFQYSPKLTTQLNNNNNNANDTLPSNKSTRKQNSMKNSSKKWSTNTKEDLDEFGCCGEREIEIPLNVTKTINPIHKIQHSGLFQHSACQIFQDQDEDSIDMATLLDHTLIPVITGSYNDYPNSNNKRRSNKILSNQSSSIVSSSIATTATTTTTTKSSLANYSPASSSSSCSASCSSTFEASSNQPETPQTPISALPSIMEKSINHARSLPSLRSNFITKMSFNNNNNNYQDDTINQNSLGLQFDSQNSNSNKSIQRSPLRERRRKPPLRIDATKKNEDIFPTSSFSSASESNPISSNSIPSSNRSSLTLGIDQKHQQHFSILSPNLVPITPTSTTLRSRKSKNSLLSPPPCPPPATPLPQLPILSKEQNLNRISIESEQKELLNIKNEKVGGNLKRESKSSIETSLPYLISTDNQTIKSNSIKQERELSYNSPHSHLSVISIDSFQTASPSSIKNTIRDSNRSSTISNINSQFKSIESSNEKIYSYSFSRPTSTPIHVAINENEKEDAKKTNEVEDVVDDDENEKDHIEESSSSSSSSSEQNNSDLHIIGLAF